MAQEYKVITWRDSGELQFLQFAPSGSARREYYDSKMKGDPSAFYSNEEEMIEIVLKEPKTLMWAGDMPVAGDQRLKALNIMDSVRAPGAYGYPKGSEFCKMFDYHLLKIKESGIDERIVTNYAPDPPLQIGIAEAEQLGYDALLFPIILLLLGICGAWILVILEHFITHIYVEFGRSGRNQHFRNMSAAVCQDI